MNAAQCRHAVKQIKIRMAACVLLLLVVGYAAAVDLHARTHWALLPLLISVWYPVQYLRRGLAMLRAFRRIQAKSGWD